MNISVRSDQTNVVSTAKKHKEEFEDLLLLVYSSLNDIDVGNFRLRLTWSLSSKKQNTPAVQEHLDNLEKLPTAQAVLNYLISRNFIGYLNYELLKVFQKVSESDELQSSIKQYELHHDAFLRLANFSTIVDTFKQHPELAPASPIGLPQFTVRFEAPWEGKSIYSWKELLERRFNWPPHINIVSISRNCIILVYSVLPFFVPAVVRDLTDHKVLSLLEREGLSVELSSDLLQLRDEVEAEIGGEANVGNKLLIGVGNLKLSSDDKNVPVRKISQTELTSLSEKDGEGKETSDEEVSVKAKTISSQDDDLTEVVRRQDHDLERLIKEGGNANKALLKAVKMGDTSVVEGLINRGADVNYSIIDHYLYGRSPLHVAAEEGHTNVVDILVTHGANVDTRDMLKRSPLHVAAEKGHTDIVDILIKHGANVDTMHEDGRSPLHVAAEEGHTNVVDILVKHGANVDTRDKLKRSPLHVPAEKGHTDVVDILVTHGANVDSSMLHLAKNKEVLRILRSQMKKDDHLVNVISLKEEVDELESLIKKGANPNKALLEAVKLNDITIIERLLKCGANVNYCDETDGRSPLHLTAEQGQTDIVNILITHGANVDTQDRDGKRPLYVAAEKGHVDIVVILLTHGANTWDIWVEGSPLRIAVENGHRDIVNILITHEAKIHPQHKTGKSRLHLMIEKGQTDISNVLITHGANVDTKDKDGRRPLHVAAEKSHTDVINTLITHGANVDTKDRDGRSPLHVAAEEGHTDVVDILVKHGAHVDTKDWYGRSPLHVAAEEGHTDVVDILVKHGSVDTKDWKSKSPLHNAVESGHTDITNMLITHGANVDKEDMFGRSPLELAHKRQYALKSAGSDSGFVMKTLRNYRSGLQQALYEKHTLLQLAEELNKKHLINMDAFVTVQAKDSREGSNIILNLLEMKVAQQPEIYEEVVITMKQISSLGKVFEEFEVEKKFSSDNDI